MTIECYLRALFITVPFVLAFLGLYSVLNTWVVDKINKIVHDRSRYLREEFFYELSRKQDKKLPREKI